MMIRRKSMSEETVTIAKSEYEGLRRAADFLDCLDAAGVDNWDGYYYARKLFLGQCDDDEAEGE
jgi:hypothetical protein